LASAKHKEFSVIITILRIKTSAIRTTELIQALRSLMRPARAEKGFLASQISLDVDDANAVRYEEQWESEEDLENQVRSSRYTRLLALMESASERPALEFHFVSETRGLEYVAAVRGEELNV
jgi:quinol monooxygenase YgiN